MDSLPHIGTHVTAQDGRSGLIVGWGTIDNAVLPISTLLTVYAVALVHADDWATNARDPERCYSQAMVEAWHPNYFEITATLESAH